METEYISCADTAKLIRAELKTNFPTIKFSVRSSTYSGGASIDIRWLDGPTGKQVESITDKYEGRSFDGMIDLAVSNYAYILPDGSVQWGGTRGTEGSMGVIAAAHVPQPIRGRRVHFGAHYVSCERRYSAEFLRRVAQDTCEKFGKRMPAIVESASGYGAYIDARGAERMNDWNYDSIADFIYRAIQEIAA